MRISDLAPNAKNPRTVTPEKLAMLKKALLEFGDLSGIVYNRKSKQLVGGHQRSKQFDADAEIVITKKHAKPTSTGTVAEGYVELHGERFSYREVSWGKHREMAANIAANKGAGAWDLAQLEIDLKELSTFDADMDLDLTLFGEDERAALFASDGSHLVKEHTRVGPTGVDEDETPEKAEPRTKLGDVYRLGQHRLVCGSATNERDWNRLKISGPAAVFSSPPYGVGGNAKLRDKYVKGAKTRTSLYDAHADDPNLWPTLMREWTTLALAHTGLVICNIQSLANNKRNVMAWANEFRAQLVDVIIWDKTHGAPQMQKNVLTNAFEWIYLLAPGETPSRAVPFADFHGDQSNVVRVSPRAEKREYTDVHGATMPVALAEWAVNLIPGADTIVDPFGGTGTTLIAAEKAGKKAALIELDPSYCDVIIARWEKYTGREAKLVNHAKAVQTKLKKKTLEQSTSSDA